MTVLGSATYYAAKLTAAHCMVNFMVQEEVTIYIMG